MAKRRADDDNAVENAIRDLRRMIFDGELKAGQPLRQDDLAAQLGTSRHPVREALGRLSGEGLVTFRARRGYIIAALGADEVTEIFDMRTVLEEHAGYFAALNRTPSDVEKAEEILLSMKELTQPNPPNMHVWSELNRDFHLTIFDASGRRHLTRVIGTLRDTVETYIRTTVIEHMSLADAWDTHAEIFESFKDGDALQLSRLSRRHVRHAAQTLLDRLRKASDQNNGASSNLAERAAAAKARIVERPR